MNDRQKLAYMKTAEVWANQSYAKKLKVGAIAVKRNSIISIGYNGTPEGWPNECEDIIGFNADGTPILKTKPEVIHAELNCISKLAKSTESGENAELFITHAPCEECAKSIIQTGIICVYYRHDYKSSSGLNFLTKSNIPYYKI